MMADQEEEYANLEGFDEDGDSSSSSSGAAGAAAGAGTGGGKSKGKSASSSSSSAAVEDDESGGGSGEGDQEDDDSTNIAKIIVATDCHIGFMEKDPIRGMDSFLAFEEVLKMARDQQADLVLLAGDLFHENKPSRFTLFKTMQILRRYVFGYNPILVQVISDQSLHFGSGSKKMGGEALFNRVNWEDPHFNVDLPIFSIHGNHDDPVREAAGASEELLAALDLLAVSNLINYFGRSETADKVDLYPVLLVKGTTKIALYGLGAMRDDRFQRLLIGNSVHFHRPHPEEADDYFSIFMIHQNRENRGLRTKMGNTSAEALLPAFLDLVIWGHEHECIPAPQKKDSTKATYVLQPGSTVATSLSEGEAAAKHCFLVEIRGIQYRSTPIKLRNVRPFGIKQLSLIDDLRLNPSAPDADERVRRALELQARKLIDRTKKEQVDDVKEEDRPPKEMRKPLIRLKVDYSGFTQLSNQRFGAVFSNEVANPQDILLFWRRPQPAARRGVASLGAGAGAGGSIDLEDGYDGYDGEGEGRGVGAGGPVMPRGLNPEVRVETLVAEQLAAAQLSILEFDSLTESLQKYVSGEAGAIKESVSASLNSALQYTKANMPDLTNKNRTDLEALLRQAKEEEELRKQQQRDRRKKQQQQQQQQQQQGRGAAAMEEDDGEEDGQEEEEEGDGFGSAARLDGSGSGSGSGAGGGGAATGRIAASKARAAGSKAALEAEKDTALAAAKSKKQMLAKTGRGGAVFVDEDEEAALEQEENEEMLAEAKGSGKASRAPPAAPSSSSSRPAAAKAAPAGKSSRGRGAAASSSSRGGGRAGGAGAGGGRGAGSAKKKKRKGSSDEHDDDEEDEDDYEDVDSSSSEQDSSSNEEEEEDDDDGSSDSGSGKGKNTKKAAPARKSPAKPPAAGASTRGRGGRGGPGGGAAGAGAGGSGGAGAIDLTQDDDNDHDGDGEEASRPPAAAVAARPVAPAPAAGAKRTAKAAGLPSASAAAASSSSAKPRDPSMKRTLPW